MIEKERKYLLKFLPSEAIKPIEIKQGYLLLGDTNHLRVRIIDDKIGFLTYKNSISIILKNEYEYEIPLNDAIELFELCKFKLLKTRYKLSFEANNIDIDIYLDGLQIVEIEYDIEPFIIPDYCGDDVSNDSYYSNIEIAKRNSLQ
jgi:adenylate cyclase